MNIKQKALWAEHVGFIAECVHAYVLSAVLCRIITLLRTEPRHMSSGWM